MVPVPFAHQVEAFEFVKDKPYSALFMEQGTGKSKVAIMKACYLYNKGLIDRVILISPNAVKEQWIEEQFAEHCEVSNWRGMVWDGFSSNRTRNEFAKLMETDCLKVVSFNVESFQYTEVDLYIRLMVSMFESRTLVIVDESTRIKNGRRKPRKGQRGGAIRTNKIIDEFEDVSYKMIMTGTPTPNGPFDLWSQFEFLCKDFFKMDYHIFRSVFGIMIKKFFQNREATVVLDEMTYNMVKSDLKKIGDVTPAHIEDLAVKYNTKTSNILKIRAMEKYSPYKDLDKLHSLISRVTFFKKKEECLDLPPKLYSKLYAEMSGEQKRIYEQLKKDMMSEYKGKELNVTSKIVLYLRLQMVTGGLFPCHKDVPIRFTEEGEAIIDEGYSYEYIASSCKLKVLLEDLEEVPEETFIIIWARFTGEINMIHQALKENGYSSEVYYSGVSNETITRFKNREFRILVANPLKGGDGLNLQVATLHYYYSNSHKADTRLQSEDRSHRLGQTNKVYYKDIVCKGTVDEKILKVLKRKENLIDYFRTTQEEIV